MWHAIIAFGKHTQSNDVGRGMPSSPLGSTKRSNDVERGMQSSPLGSTHGRMTSGVASHHRLLTAHTVEQRQAWHAIIAFGQHTLSNDVGRERTSPPLDDTLGRMTSGVACRHRLRAVHTVKRREAWHAIIAFGQHKHSKDVGCGMPSPPLDCTNSRTTSGVAFNHRV